MDRGAFGRAIAAERDRQGLTKLDLARLAGTHESLVRATERGSCPSVMIADRLVAALGMRMVIGQEGSRKVLRVDAR